MPEETDVYMLMERLAFGTIGRLFGTTYNLERNLANAFVISRKMNMVPFHR